MKVYRFTPTWTTTAAELTGTFGIRFLALNAAKQPIAATVEAICVFKIRGVGRPAEIVDAPVLTDWQDVPQGTEYLAIEARQLMNGRGMPKAKSMGKPQKDAYRFESDVVSPEFLGPGPGQEKNDDLFGKFEIQIFTRG